MERFPPQAVVFDMDGVIVDSFAVNSAYYNYIARRLGLPALSPEDELEVHRQTHEKALLHFAGAGRLAEAYAAGREREARDLQTRHTMFPGVRQTLARLAAQVPLAVGTNRDQSSLLILQQLEIMQYFKLVVTPAQAPEAKPAAAFIDYLLQELGFIREQVVYVGDSAVDQDLCLNAGLRLLAFRNPELKAWRHVDNFAAIPAVLGLA
jgi:phosphoglycolate phosphatase-like HAD superfamily hydrolase